ncbi:MAG: DUF427 domain-containing protein [Kofleriaceae bacterium]
MAERVTIEQVPHIKVSFGTEVIAESTSGYVVHEQGLSDRYYVPRADIKAQLADGTGAGTCPWKGEWKHLDVTVGGTKIANGAWTYFESKPATAPTKDMVAFYENKFQISR